MTILVVFRSRSIIIRQVIDQGTANLSPLAQVDEVSTPENNWLNWKTAPLPKYL